MLAYGRGRWAVSQKPKLILSLYPTWYVSLYINYNIGFFRLSPLRDVFTSLMKLVWFCLQCFLQFFVIDIFDCPYNANQSKSSLPYLACFFVNHSIGFLSPPPPRTASYGSPASPLWFNSRLATTFDPNIFLSNSSASPRFFLISNSINATRICLNLK